jgi:tRNA (guanine-N7-)-methyltransferase
VEIREPLVVRANRWAKEADIGNCFFSFANMNASIKTILKGYPGTISLVTILMPDPWFKSRHHKRRVVQPEFVDSLAEEMPIGSKLIIGSDVHDVFQVVHKSRLDLRSGFEVSCGVRGVTTP